MKLSHEGFLEHALHYLDTASCSVGPLISGNDSQLVATFNLNAYDTQVGGVWCNYLACHLSNVMQFMPLTHTIFLETLQCE